MGCERLVLHDASQIVWDPQCRLTTGECLFFLWRRNVQNTDRWQMNAEHYGENSFKWPLVNSCQSLISGAEALQVRVGWCRFFGGRPGEFCVCTFPVQPAAVSDSLPVCYKTLYQLYDFQGRLCGSCAEITAHPDVFSSAGRELQKGWHLTRASGFPCIRWDGGKEGFGKCSATVPSVPSLQICAWVHSLSSTTWGEVENGRSVLGTTCLYQDLLYAKWLLTRKYACSKYRL